MSFDLTGTLYEKFQLIQRTATFRIREFIVETSREFSGKTIFNYIKFQTTQDRTDLIEKFNPGDKIKVQFDIRGSKWEKNGQVSYFNNLEAFRIDYAENAAAQNDDLPDRPAPDAVDDSGESDDLPF